MPYAEGRVFCDADSHVMETRGWLEPFADPEIRPRLRPFDPDLSMHRPAHLPLEHAGVLDSVRHNLDDPAARAEAERMLMLAKEWAALGASDPKERSAALDLLGFAQQLVFPTFAWTQFDHAGSDLDLLYGGARATNRRMAAFCAHDPRLLAVGIVPLADPARDVPLADEAIRLGCRALQLCKEPRADVSPAHPVYDGLWARLQEARVPFVLHIGNDGRRMHRAFYNNGIPRTSEFLIDGESLLAKDLMAISHAAEVFLNALVLDGVLERFPRLRGGCIELGALWVVSWLRRLDLVQRIFVKAEPHLALPLPASDYVRRQLRFTPYSQEPVGWMIEQAGDDLFLFSSDYPHPEGGRNPLKRFEESLAAAPERAKQRFYSGNFQDLVGITPPA
jgi:predicted TIM-barrel fold metal-dependent hydrolase